jgi:hypothetical protein
VTWHLLPDPPARLGTIPTPHPLPLPQLGSLTYLDLSNNTGIRGTLPAEWGVLSHLHHLDVSGNTGLTGTLPSAWSVSPCLRWHLPRRHSACFCIQMPTHAELKPCCAGPSYPSSPTSTSSATRVSREGSQVGPMAEEQAQSAWRYPQPHSPLPHPGPFP